MKVNSSKSFSVFLIFPASLLRAVNEFKGQCNLNALASAMCLKNDSLQEKGMSQMSSCLQANTTRLDQIQLKATNYYHVVLTEISSPDWCDSSWRLVSSPKYPVHNSFKDGDLWLFSSLLFPLSFGICKHVKKKALCLRQHIVIEVSLSDITFTVKI